MTPPGLCRLCSGKVSRFYEALKPFSAVYYRCSKCDLVQMDELSFLPGEQEKSHYQMHENDKRDQGYIDFLDRCLKPLQKYLAQGMSGLDYGCGPYPMLAELMSERGFPMDAFDPYFFPDHSKIKERYDFVTATEVVEHFNEPRASWKKLSSKVRQGGVLAVMTSIRYQETDFDRWHYRRDETHVCFYSEKTFNWISKEFNLEVLEMPRNVVIFRKN